MPTLKSPRMIGGKKYRIINQEDSKKQAEGLAKHIRSIGHSARITTHWGFIRSGRRVKIYAVWESISK